MTRPRKQVVDYFPHDCNSSSKKTIFIVEQRFGNDGYAFWFKLLELLGSTEGHFIDCNNPATWEFLQAKTRLGGDMCRSLLSLLSNTDAIDKELWENGIIWSDNFVEGIESVYQNRKCNKPHKPVYNGITTVDNRTERDNEPLPTGINPQSKVNYSKPEYSKKEKTTEDIKKKSKKAKAKKEEAELIYPDCVKKDLIDEYFQNRKDLKKAMTHRAKELFLLKVDRFHKAGQDVKAAIEKSIMSGYTDIYEEKSNNGYKPVQKAKSKFNLKDIDYTEGLEEWK